MLMPKDTLSPEIGSGLAIGTIEGPMGWLEVRRRLRGWAGPQFSWRDLVGAPPGPEAPPRLTHGLLAHQRRLTGGISLVLGWAKSPRRRAKENDDE
ncbi:hypothetical protein ACVFYP_22440 [Roseomonas sp. F4]